MPIVYSIAECKPSSNVEITCENDCIFNMDEDIQATLNVYIDNIGLESTQVKFYLHNVGERDNCLDNPSQFCIQKQISGTYINNGQASVTFTKLGEYKETEITAKLSKDGSVITKKIFIRPAIKLTLSYPLEYSTGQYIVNQLTKVDVIIKNLVNQQTIIDPSTFECKFYKGNNQFTPNKYICSPIEISFTPDSTGTYRIWAKSTYTGKDQYGSPIIYFPSEYFIDLDVQLPQQKIQAFLNGINLKSLPKTSEGAYEVETKSYAFQIKSSLNNEPYRLEACNIQMQEPDGTPSFLSFAESKCRSGIDTECIYSASYEFLQSADSYRLDGTCEHNEEIIPFSADFVTLAGKQKRASIIPILVGVGIGIVVLIIFVVILLKARGNRPQQP